MPVDKDILNRGVRILSWSIPAVFIGPTLIHFAYINKQQPLFPVLLGAGVLIGIAGIVFIFKGIITIVNSLSDR